MSRSIEQIVIHCSASLNGRSLGGGGKSAAEVMDAWHSRRSFMRHAAACRAFNPRLPALGYHWVIDCGGILESGRNIDEIGAHVAGHNARSIGICLVGSDAFTASQWAALASQIRYLQRRFPTAQIVGHRDLSPDLNGDGKITPNEYRKTCPGFSVADWLAGDMQPLPLHLIGGANAAL